MSNCDFQPYAVVVAVAGVAIAAAMASAPIADASASQVRVETVARGLEHPWGLTFLPDGAMLVTERPGRVRLVAADGSMSDPIAGAPQTRAFGQGGLLDVALHPDFASNGLVYFTFAELDGGSAGTAVARARLVRTEGAPPRFEGLQTIFRMNRKSSGNRHFGSRLAFAPDGTLFVTIGDRGEMERAQVATDHAGSVLRIADDGAVPPDNPFADGAAAEPEIWSFGHRNPQGAAIHPDTGALWTVEHGPRGGDELNIPRRGANHGWPVISYGVHYSGRTVGEGTEKEGMEQPIHYWDPSVSPSGLMFYTGDVFPDWRGDLFTGGLSGQVLVRLELDGERVTGEERLLGDLGMRIRDVRQGPDGHIYLLTDSGDGRILKLSPPD
ncbi:glucose/arabinose dehydrogenase [Tepidamorphus gemmatus]|uniref:Glucose/arabinose dehydrogenase n=1 Tax=Tepidamorphus gemmatus TaxID=747076 RepID=A0A4R3MIN9_9HYPH|nr:PQQ-dependent sugar dehydrogenase [Tepidamorphus gemmatus]TCT13677.1 glucose/arabinose dehydrogenase [Tepidamorphus gemmatus]